MRRRLPQLLLTLAALAAPSSTALADHPATYKGRFDFAVTNVQGATQAGGLAPYLAAGDSDLIGKHTQTGSILNTSGLIPIDDTTLIFRGEVGPNPFVPGNPKVHVIDTRNGQIFCTWTA